MKYIRFYHLRTYDRINAPLGQSGLLRLYIPISKEAVSNHPFS